MRWNSLITASSDGDRSAEVTVHMTEHEAAIIALALENLIQDAFGDGPEIQEWYGFTPAHYVAIKELIDWIEGATSMTRAQLREVKWWETFEQLDARDWEAIAPRCDLPRYTLQEMGIPTAPALFTDEELDEITRIIDPFGVLQA